ncbi:MAG TPA: hypothetical protein VGL99_10055 [Chloroflexota bacterium]
MERCIWIHQFSQLGERTAEDIATTLTARGITRIYVKAMDGTDWMSNFYDHPLAPANATQLAQLVIEFSNVGVQLIPWVVNRFRAAEADAHSACGTAAGAVVIDFEYLYGGFWQGSLDEAQGYFDKMRAAAGNGLWVAVAPDPRQVGRDYRRDLISGLTAYLPQNYWTDFQRPWLEVMENAAANVEPLGPTEPILPYNARRADMEACIAWCEQRPYASVSLWRMGTANGAQLDAFGTTPVVVEPHAEEPAPVEVNGVPKAYVDRGWDSWPAVAINLESIIHELIDERDAALAKLDAVERRVA